MKKSLIFILSIICALILLDSYISPIDNSINNESNANNNAFYLDHNITINKNQTVSFNNENIEVFTNNISITDYGTGHPRIPMDVISGIFSWQVIV